MALLRALPALALLALLSSCAAPIWPRYKVEKQSYELVFTGAPSSQLAFRAEYRLQNTGDRALAHIDVALPDAATTGLTNVRISLDGAAVTAAPVPGAAGNLVRIAFSPVWPVKKKLSLSISYDLSIRNHHQNKRAALEDSFYFSGGLWYPMLQAPEGHVSAGGEAPDEYDVVVRVPEGFLVHAAGRPRGVKTRAGLRDHRFTIQRNDFAPFVISGRYHEQRFTVSGFPIIFWTTQPVAKNELQAAANLLGQTVAVFEDLFGPRFRPASPVWIVESLPRPDYAGLFEVYFADVLQLTVGALKDTATLHPESVDAVPSLAWLWTSSITSPSTLIELWLSRGIDKYAGRVAAERRGVENAVRENGVEVFEGFCDAASEYLGMSFVELATVRGSVMADRKATVILHALHERVGAQTLHRALRRMIQARRGRDWTVNDFRSALEAESGQDLAEFFRKWLNEPGIPAGYCERYSKP